MKDFKNKSVGQIVSHNIEYAKVFKSFGVDFCCGGDLLLTQAVDETSVAIDAVVEALEKVESSSVTRALDFNQWSLDLLIDYLIKFHHDYIRQNGAPIVDLLNRVVEVHGEAEPHLYEVKELFVASLSDLNNHLDKEEGILFPLIRDLLVARAKGESLPQFHCGSVENPIRVMMEEHDDEGVRFRTIAKLTANYTPPATACNSYKLVLDELRQFEENLHIHIHVENNILFPKSLELQESFG